MDASDIERLEELIESKGWRAFDGKLRGRKDNVDKILTSFLSKMSKPQRHLAIELLSDYLILKDYTDPAIELLESIYRETNSPLKIAPVKVKNANRIKSGDALIYEMDSHQNVAGERDIKFSDDPYDPKFWEGDQTRVLVDDFIGTGDQFVGMIDEIRNSGAEPNIDFLATIVIQEDGRRKVEARGIRVISLYTRPRALETLAVKLNRGIDDVKNLYLEIEESTKCNWVYSCGYLGSEAIVTMKKTPDNTLPIFWHEEGSGWPAPFLRKLK